MKIHIGANAVHHRHNGLIKKTKEDIDSHKGGESNHNKRSNWAGHLIQILGSILHDPVADKSIENSKSNLSEHNEGSSQVVGEHEPSSMFHLKHDSKFGRCAEGLT